MRKPLFLLLVMILGFCFGCSREVPSNERPMYGNIPKTAYQEEVDEQFIKTVVEQFGSKEAAAKKHVEFAWHYYDNGDQKTAMKRFNQAWLLDPSNAEVYFGFGVLMSEKGQLDDAIDMYDKALQINPNYADAYHNRGIDYSRKSNFNKALLDFSKAIEIKPNNGQTYNDRAIAYFEKREYDKSWQDVHKAEELGYEIHPSFLKALKKASKREK